MIGPTRSQSAALEPVAVFDAALPTGVATIRSLGRAGVPVHAFCHHSTASGRYSRYASRFDVCPDPTSTDRFVPWLQREVDNGRISLIAPTSDYIAHAVAELDEATGRQLSGGVGGQGGVVSVWNCLFKDRFYRKLDELGFPVPDWAIPRTTDEAISAATDIGYPVVLKPRSHIGVGVARGVVARTEEELIELFTPYELGHGGHRVLRHDPDLALPLLQRLVTGDHVECLSVTGWLDDRGVPTAVSVSRKTEHWGGSLAIGTAFEDAAPPPFIEHALDTVSTMLGSGIFELEVLVDRGTGRYWAIDLNPRCFGQISFDIGRGHDLPALWYQSATGAELPRRRRPRRAAPTKWRMAVPYYTGLAAGALLGPNRLRHVRHITSSLASPAAGAVHAWSDPGPGIALTALMLRNPGGLIRPFVVSRNGAPASLRRSVAIGTDLPTDLPH